MGNLLKESKIVHILIGLLGLCLAIEVLDLIITFLFETITDLFKHDKKLTPWAKNAADWAEWYRKNNRN